MTPAEIEAPFFTPRKVAADLGPVLVLCVGEKTRLDRLARAAARRARTLTATSIDDAVALARAGEPVAVVGDPHGLADEATAGVRALRSLARARPALVCSRLDDPRIPNEAIRMDARYAFGDDIDEHVERFVERVVISRRDMDVWLDAAVTWLAREWKLGDRERAVLALVGTFASVEEIATRLGVSPGSVRRHLALLRARSGLESTSSLARHLRDHARARFGRF